MPVEEELDMREACAQFLKAANKSRDTSTYIPAELMTPSLLYDIDNVTKELLLEAIRAVPPKNLLLIVLGEGRPLHTLIDRIFVKEHDILNQPIVTAFEGQVSILVIDPTLPSTQEMEIKDPMPKDKVASITLVKAIFPLTPVYGPHKYVDFPTLFKFTGLSDKQASKSVYFQQPKSFESNMYGIKNRNGTIIKNGIKNTFVKSKSSRLFRTYIMAVRRLVYENALEVLNALVERESPLFISSRITKQCYRSFKYLIDIRNLLQRQTIVRYEYTELHGPIEECDTVPIFPEPFQRCSKFITENDKTFKKYYFDESESTENLVSPYKETIVNYTKRMNKFANDMLKEKIPKTNTTVSSSSSSASLGAGAGQGNNRRNRTHKNARKNRKTRKNK
jgi:hypothetical protein